MLKVEITRGDYVESTHQVHARVESANGTVLLNSSKDFDFFPRSAIKPIQSYLLLKSGAYEGLNLDLRHLALASSSHIGEKQHTDLVLSWLEKLELDQAALRCGAHAPGDADSSFLLRQNNQQPRAIHNNCSGKHTGFLSVCKHLKFPIENYHHIEHPLQQKLKQVLENELECELKHFGIDGCSIPAFYMSFHQMSRAFAKMAGRAYADSNSAAGMGFQALARFPELTSGKDQYYTQVMVKNSGRILSKGGAEGIVAGIIPEKKISILVKSSDGSHRGAQSAFDYLVHAFGGLEMALSPLITNWVGTHVGVVRVALPL